MGLRVIITGAAGGIGRECAHAFARWGAELILCDHDGPELSGAADRCGAFSRFCDVASESSVNIFAAEILAAFPDFHIVINAAGSGYVRSLGMVRISRALLPGLRRACGTKFIFNIAPAEFPEAQLTLFPYAGSDLAFTRLSNALARQTRGSSIAVVTIAPQRQHGETADTDESLAQMLHVDALEPATVATRIMQYAVPRIT